MRRKIIYDPNRDYYAILGIDASATPEDIQHAYRQNVRRVHPDLNQDRADWATEQIQLLNEAYDVLGHPSRRRQYDQLRWPHVPSRPQREPGYRSPFSEPDYDLNRPWWEQVAERAPRGYPFGDSPPQPPDWSFEQRQPFWITLGNWMTRHGLAALEPIWLTLVGLWRSPYAGALGILTLALGINIAGVVYVASTPQRWASVRDWLDAHNGEASAPPTLTPDRLILTCDDPGVQIKTPFWGDVVGDEFSVYGTVQHPELWNYTLAVGFVGDVATVTTTPATWTLVREPPHNQSIPEPSLEDTLLTEQPVNLSGQPAGFYVIRLRVTLRSGKELQPCDIVVRH
jgi:hypothetical protein